jgi:hypothetical protein
MVSPTFLRFHQELESTHRKACEITGQDFPVLKELIRKYGAVKAAKTLLSDEYNLNDGFIRLRDRKMLDYSVEQVVLNYESSGLFTPDEIEVAKKRLNVW